MPARSSVQRCPSRFTFRLVFRIAKASDFLLKLTCSANIKVRSKPHRERSFCGIEMELSIDDMILA